MPGDAWAKFKAKYPGLAKVKLEQEADRKAGRPIRHPELLLKPKKKKATPKRK